MILIIILNIMKTYINSQIFFVYKIIHTMNQLKLKLFAGADSKINGIEFVHPGDTKYLKD